MSQSLLIVSPKKTKQLVEHRGPKAGRTPSFQQAGSTLLLQRTLGNHHIAKLIQTNRLTSKGGRSLQDSVRSFMKPRFGVDRGNVSIHTHTERTAGISRSENKDVGRSNFISPMGKIAAPLADDHVQRTIHLGGANLDSRGVRQLTNELISTKLRDIVPRVISAQLVRETVREMQAVSEILSFGDADAVAEDVRHRVLLSHYMRQSQGSTPLRKAFSYPDRRGDGTVGVGPKVNDAATAYWGPVQDDYYFDLSPAGIANPYEALLTLFTEQTDPHKRTLIHCDYVVSVLQFRAYAETIGIPRFNSLVQAGALTASGEGPMRLKWNGFDELLNIPTIRSGTSTSPLMPTAPLKTITVANKDSLIVGDHVRFYNHQTYDALIEQVGGVWRLENAIVIDRVNGKFRFQGHGYFSPVTEDVLLNGMIRQYNLHVDDARRIVSRIDHGSPATRAVAETERLSRYRNVERKPGGGWRVTGLGLCGTTATRDLKHLTPAEAPGLIDPCSGTIEVRRPAER